MATCYAVSVSKDEVGTTEAAAELGVSVDTIHAMIRDELLPARRVRPGGPFAISRADLDKVHGHGPRGIAGLSTLSAAELNEARRAQDEYLAAKEAAKRAKQQRDETLGRLAAKAEGFGALSSLARAVGMHRVSVSRLGTARRRGSP